MNSFCMEHETRFELAAPAWPNVQSLALATRSWLVLAACRLLPLFRWHRVAILEFIDVYEVYRA
jgi:hypothetical protein